MTEPEAGSRPRAEADLDDPAVAAAGKLSEALEWIERARGRLYDFHQLVGHADFLLDEAAGQLEDAGHAAEADAVRRELIGRNVVAGHWTFQLVEEFDDDYYAVFRETERRVREQLTAGRRHVFEAALKERRRTHGLPGHERGPQKRA